jgi:hypothetical protein
MNGGWLEKSHFPVTERGPDADRFSKAITKVQLDFIRRDVHQFS